MKSLLEDDPAFHASLLPGPWRAASQKGTERRPEALLEGGRRRVRHPIRLYLPLWHHHGAFFVSYYIINKKFKLTGVRPLSRSR